MNYKMLRVKQTFLFNIYCNTDRKMIRHLKPTFGRHEVVFHHLFSKLISDVQAHRAVLVINLPFGFIVENGVGIVDLFKLLSRFWIVGVFIWVILQC